jgi:glycosyltransferase involved in cell wall biosynthesis/ubiquinone/menaquinone biosynthesis C-methylase UbiE
VLDAGCGAGALVETLRAAGAEEIVGADASAEMIALARSRFGGDRWLRADIAQLPLASDAFDAVVSLGVLEYVDDRVAAMRELARVARPGGLVIVSAPHPRSPNHIALRLAVLFGRGTDEGSRPPTLRELRRALAGAVLERTAFRATNFFVFPLSNVLPRASQRIAELLDPLGRLPVMRSLGSQLVGFGRRPLRRPVFWLVPAVPTSTTFLARELEALRALNVDVVPLEPTLRPRAALAFLRRPLRALRLCVELQRRKAPRDRERGRLGYVVLFLRGLALAERIEGSPGRIHAAFADGVGTAAYVAATLAGRPYSFTAHSPYSLWQGSDLLRAQARAATTVACQSEEIQRRMQALAGDIRTHVVRSPAPAPPPRQSSPGTRLVLCVGHLIPHKGFATAIRAVARAVADGADVELEVIGDGPERIRLERLICELEAAKYIRLAGARPNEDVLDRLADALVLLAPCEVQSDEDRDGLPVSIIDAAICAVPTIATPVAGVPELVIDGETGLLVPERSPEKLADAIRRVADEPALARALGARARELALRQHDPLACAGELLRAWGDVDASPR